MPVQQVFLDFKGLTKLDELTISLKGLETLSINNLHELRCLYISECYALNNLF